MKRIRITVVAAVVALFIGLVPAQPAQAAHTCGLEDVPIVGPVCDGYHDPKLVLQYLV